MNKKIHIREAKQEDMHAVLQLIHELAVFEKEPNAVDITENTLIEAALGSSPSIFCFVAEVDALIVGTAIAYFRFSTWKGKTVHLEDLIVTQSMRGKGIGESLYNKVLHFAEGQGAKRVEWVVLDWNKGAIDFYKKSGATILKDWNLVQMDEIELKAYLNKK
ncbi:GNAT family N-acetyltransferase [Patiriisocius hiemis]|uniref:GNAT family N-acetyltransferase n=1 Tax=Patiriisocius hiemis TaxID=3075604 RepID=A0ABU2YDP3_9FLAO|nr:GNAT family N-acetyltransferase [Constantimarinum sp. W242]MDT0555370.1 GNAT family N-acetyltransferase [Constantimarinum sp. W242]